MRHAYILSGLALFAAGCAAAPQEPADSASAEDMPCEEGLDVGQCPPDVQVVDTDGQAISLLQQRGPVTLIASEAMW